MFINLYLRSYDLAAYAPTALFGHLRQWHQPAFFWDPAGNWEAAPLVMAFGGQKLPLGSQVEFQLQFNPPQGLNEIGGILNYHSAQAQAWAWLPAFWLVLQDDLLHVIAQVPEGESPDFWALERQLEQVGAPKEPFELLGPWEVIPSEAEENQALSMHMQACLRGDFDFGNYPRLRAAAYQGDVWTRFRQMRQKQNYFHSFFIEDFDFQAFGWATHYALEAEAQDLKLELLAGAWGRTGRDRHDWQRVGELLQAPYIQGPHQSRVRAWQGHLQHFGDLLEAFPLLEMQFSQTLILGHSCFQLQKGEAWTGFELLGLLQQAPQFTLGGQQVGRYGDVLLRSDALGRHRAFFFDRVAWTEGQRLYTCLPASIHAHTEPQFLAAEARRHAQTAMF